MASKWVDDEIEYWVENFGADRIRLVLTDSEIAQDELLSETILHSKINAKPWIDLRGFSNGSEGDFDFSGTQFAPINPSSRHGKARGVFLPCQ